jgi:hypothetical protein
MIKFKNLFSSQQYPSGGIKSRKHATATPSFRLKEKFIMIISQMSEGELKSLVT